MLVTEPLRKDTKKNQPNTQKTQNELYTWDRCILWIIRHILTKLWSFFFDVAILISKYNLNQSLLQGEGNRISW
jgi:hypothetical protein